MFRRISTSLRAAKALSVEDWAALNTAFPSNTAITNIALNTTKTAIFIASVTGTAVVCASDRLHGYRLAKLEAKMSSLETKMEAKMNSLETKMEAKMNSLETKMEAKMNSLETKMENLMGKLSSIEEQFAKAAQAQGR